MPQSHIRNTALVKQDTQAIATNEANVSHGLPQDVANASLKDYIESIGASFPISREEIFGGFLP